MSGGPPNVTFDKTSLYPTFPTSYENSPASYRVFVDLTTPVKPVVGQYHPASKGKSNKSHSKRGLLFKIKEPLPGNNASLGISVSPSGLRRVEMVPQRAPLETVYRQPPIQAGNIHKPKYQAPQIQQKMQPRPVQQKIPVQKSIQMTVCSSRASRSVTCTIIAHSIIEHSTTEPVV